MPDRKSLRAGAPQKTSSPSAMNDDHDALLGTADLHASLQVCLEKIQQLERENETHIKRLAAMQAELDHLRAIVSRTS